MTQHVSDSLLNLRCNRFILGKTFSVYRSSAGSGKTRTLAKAYLRLALQYRADYFKHILAVTFTNKASQEMKDRILEYIDAFAKGEGGSLAAALQSELKMDPQTFRQYSQEVQSTLLHKYDHFAISTIDAFFQKVIRAFIREAGLVGDYRLEVDQDAVLEDVIDNLVSELGTNKELTDWVVEFAGENLENERSWDVRQSLIRFAHEIFRETFKDVEDTVNQVTAQVDYFRTLRNRLWKVKAAFLADVTLPARECAQALRESGYSIDDFKYGKGSGLQSFLEGNATARTVGKCKPPGGRVKNEFTVAENWPGRKCADPAGLVALARKTLVPRVERMVTAFEENYTAALSAEVALQNMYVFGLITDISRKLKEYKDENNVMLLADAPKFLNGIIRDSDTPFIYEKVGSFFRNFLIDEFQDTSGLQWQNFQPLIVNSLDQGHQSLIVGDVKQAIYRWRGGDLNLLQEKIVDVVGDDRAEVYELVSNYRSDAGVVAFNNAVFGRAAEILATDGVGAAVGAYADVTQQTSSQAEGFVEITFLPDEKNEDHPEQTRSWKALAMERIPKTLETLQENGVSLKDIAILVRRNDEGQRIAAFLLQYKNSPEAKADCAYDVVSNESLRVDGAGSVNLLLAAMRYLLNAEDSIARAQLAYEFARLHEPERELSEVFTVTNQAVFENNLPPAFTKSKTAMKKLPLVELTETLIDIFRLGHVAGELVYLQTFQDLVLEFSNRERNDLGAFLEWWEINRSKKSIQVSGEVDAVQILTIHKSKGLQFRYVLIPFCAWSMDHDSWQAPNLWVQSTEEPFAEAGYLPVRYGSNLKNTFFSSYYEEERMKTALDNLNLLYVAFTRAESGLIVSAPCEDNHATRGSIAKLLYDSMNGEPQLEGYWDSGRRAWRKGTIAAPPVEDERRMDTVQLLNYLTSPWRDKLVIRQSGAQWFGAQMDAQMEKASYGIHMHAVLSRMHYSDDVADTLSQIVVEGLITEDERALIEAQLASLMDDPQIAHWFSREWEVRTEVPILLPDGQEPRIDRLLTQGKRAVVVDFKTGAHKASDEQQVLQYVDILRKMNYTEVNGYLLYIGKNEVVEVKRSGRPRMVTRRRDDDQLELF